MTTAGVVLISAVLALLIIGIPIAVALGAASMFAIQFIPRISELVIVQKLFTSVDSFCLMAIPFFMMVGELMMQGGISRCLVNLIQLFLGKLRGSLAYISVVCIFWGNLCLFSGYNCRDRRHHVS